MRNVEATGISFDWNGQEIAFDAWDVDAFGLYEYTTRDERYAFAFEVTPGEDGTVRTLIVEERCYDETAAPIDYASWCGVDDEGNPFIAVAGAEAPESVPQALVQAVWWAETIAARSGQEHVT